MSNTRRCVAFAAVALLGVAANAHAVTSQSSVTEAPWTTVSTAGLDTDGDAGARAVLQRIRVAARRVCGADPDIRHVDLTVPQVTCVRATVDHAVGVLDNPRVAALNAQGGRPAAILAANRR